jgi:hypothetical protein
MSVEPILEEQPEEEYEPTPEEAIRGKVARELVAELEKWDKVSNDQLMIAYRLIWITNNPEGPPFHVDDNEKNLIKLFQTIGLSMAQIAFIFHRSTSSIHAALSRKETEQTNVSPLIDI